METDVNMRTDQGEDRQEVAGPRLELKCRRKEKDT